MKRLLGYVETIQLILGVTINKKFLTYVEVDMECYRIVNVISTDAERRSI